MSEIEEKIKKLEEERDAIRFFDGPEMDGVNLSQSVRKDRIQAQIDKLIQDNCEHTDIMTYKSGSSIYSYFLITECKNCNKIIEKKNISVEADPWR